MNQQSFGNQKLQFVASETTENVFQKNESVKVGILEKFKRSRMRKPTRHGAKIFGRKGSNV